MSDQEKIHRVATYVTNEIVNSTGNASLRGQAKFIYDTTIRKILEMRNNMNEENVLVSIMNELKNKVVHDGKQKELKAYETALKMVDNDDVDITTLLEQETQELNNNDPRSLQNSPIPSPADIVNSNLVNNGGRRKKRKTSVPKRYVPKQLSKKDKKKQARELKKSRRAYKKGKYHTRKKMKSFKSKVSPHIIKARKMYKVDKITPNKKLAKACGCKIQGLRKIVKKGQGAYFSSGSRPNQTGHSWGYARMASSITGGKASAVDYKILEKYCTKKSKALKLAKKMRGKGTRRVKQVKIGGRRKTRKY